MKAATTARKPSTRRTRKPAQPECVRLHCPPDDGPLCPDCGGETFWDHDDAGPVLVCLDCVAFTITDLDPFDAA